MNQRASVRSRWSWTDRILPVRQIARIVRRFLDDRIRRTDRNSPHGRLSRTAGHVNQTIGSSDLWRLNALALERKDRDDRSRGELETEHPTPVSPGRVLCSVSTRATSCRRRGFGPPTTEGLWDQIAPPITSAQTRKLRSVLGPNVVVMATSAASRPRASNTRPIRGVLFRGSKVCHSPPR